VAGSAVTNVVKLFANLAGHVTPETLALQDEQEKILADGASAAVQVAKYIHGVGDSSNPLIRILGGAFGLGVIGRIVRGYTYISRNYAAGDAICIAGFSRGAYTARALAGMIAKIGLLNPKYCDPNNKAEAYRYGIAAWARSKSVVLQNAGELTPLANALLNFVETFVAKQLPVDGLIANVPIKAVAVWDTVGSMGIPEYVGDRRLDVFRFIDLKLSDMVEYGFHAMAIDEMRIDFPVTRWDDRQKIGQVWFIGAHADVGGGYPAAESRLSDETLSWMMKQLSSAGVSYATPLIYPPDARSVGQPIHTPWKNPPFDLMPTSPRKVMAGDTLHASVAARWNADNAYRPASMAAFAAAGLANLKSDNGKYA
jgi:glutathione S-transferase